MSVQIANDPHGNAAIMRGIIDCLPRVNQVWFSLRLHVAVKKFPIVGL